MVLAHLSKRERQRVRRERDWYECERGKIERQLEEISDSDLVRVGPDIESVIFFAPHEVDCPHDRRRKRCVAIRDKLETLKLLRGLKEANAEPWRRLTRRLRISQAGMDRLVREIVELRVSPATADPGDFCSEISFHPADPRERAELGGGTGRDRPSGRPLDDLRGYLFETIGERLHQQGCTYRDACQLVAKVLKYSFGQNIDQDGREDVTETLEREWRDLRHPRRKKQPTS